VGFLEQLALLPASLISQMRKNLKNNHIQALEKLIRRSVPVTIN
jgi:hypothetical protein